MKFSSLLIVLFSEIFITLGCSLFILIDLSPISLATLMKNSLTFFWEIYRKQRNLVTKIKRDSIKTYFYERTAGGPRATSFYQTKPFFSGKTKNSNNNIVLCENDSIVNDFNI
jgi:hypothetical protein